MTKILDLKRVNRTVTRLQTNINRALYTLIAIIMLTASGITLLYTTNVQLLSHPISSFVLIFVMLAFIVLMSRFHRKKRKLFRYLRRFESRIGIRYYANDLSDPEWQEMLHASQKRTLHITVTRYMEAVTHVLKQH